jgi:hypothetical protein
MPATSWCSKPDAQSQPGDPAPPSIDQEAAHRSSGRTAHHDRADSWKAEPGDVLKVTINKIVPRAYATNFNVPGCPPVPKEYQDGQVKQLYLD